MQLLVPVLVKGFDEAGTAWEEMTSLLDTSAGGALIKLNHPSVAGQVVHLSLPLPKRYRQYDLSEMSYQVWGLIRHVRSGPEGRRIGVYYLGKKPPRDFEKNPGGRYLLPSDPPPKPAERRKFLRLDVFLNVKLTRPDDQGGLREEVTVAENVGPWGARVLTSLPVSKGDVIDVHEVGGDYRTRAHIRNVYIGKDQVPRLNLQFETRVPERLIGFG
jgi:hypothetical protein